MVQGRREEPLKSEQVLPTERVKRVIEHAFGNAQKDGRASVDTGDLLVGILLEPHGIAAQVLMEHGVTPGGVESALAKIGPTRDREAMASESPPITEPRFGEWTRRTDPPIWNLKFQGKPGPPLEVMVFFQHQYSEDERQRIGNALLAALTAAHS
jgi:ATP-dependent Clp protease ATP-binding subunit ClpA